MTHTQTQGADGAGTKTAGQTMVLLPMDDPRRPLNDSGLPSVMIWAGGQAYDEFMLSGAAEDGLDLDSCSLAVGIYRAMTEARAKEIATLSPAQPAATPGVPDSLREAFAAATDSPVFVHDFADPAVSSAPGCQDVSLSFVTPDHITAAFMGNGLAGTIDQARKDAVALAAAWNHVRALIAAQPAGQAGDAGAETERLREAVSKALHDNQFLDGWPEMVDPVVEAVLAARPEAPSDAGWVKINDEARNGAHWLVARPGSKPIRAYFEGGRWWMHGAGRWSRRPADLTGAFEPTHYQPLPTAPSDPAPSGQAEG